MLGIPYTLNEIAECGGAKDLFQGANERRLLRYASFDTRTISHGAETLFVALRSPHRDGHDYLQAAYDKGVRHFLVEKPLPWADVQYALCHNTLEVLQQWAAYHRQRFAYPVVGITGSNGKTTVKEWLATLLEGRFQLVKSPMSYNSQLGVAISLLQMRPDADIAIIEAGISQMGEMEMLHALIQPTLGIFTHFGAAHADGFPDEATKFREKCLLFQGCKAVIANEAERNPPLLAASGKLSPPERGVFLPQTATKQPLQENIIFAKQIPTELPSWEGTIPRIAGQGWVTPADRENIALAVAAARYLGLSEDEISERLPLLQPVEMRTEIISDNPDITLINDSYNADPDSVRNAFHLLKRTNAQPRKVLILTDIAHLGSLSAEMHKTLLAEAIQAFSAENIYTIGEDFARVAQEMLPTAHIFPTTEALLETLPQLDFRQSVVLLKGGRRFALERVIPLLQKRLNATYYRINLNTLVENFRYLKSCVPAHTKTMCMVKAASYGGGTWELAQTLAQAGADYFAVAYVSEGIELRERGIRQPIMVMNPDVSGLHALVQYELEPEIFDLALLEKYIRTAKLMGATRYPLHLKFDTGMGRLGFTPADIPTLAAVLLQYPDVEIRSVMSHLAAADEPTMADFTHAQAERFIAMTTQFSALTGAHPPRHLLNSAGIERFPEYAFEMVRMGIGLYSSNSEAGGKLQEIGSLRTIISQIHHYPQNTSIGYGRSQFTERESRIATIPIGYADAIPRALSNGKGAFLVRGQRAPIMGRVCMDMLMLDVTDIPDAAAGDEVVIFGEQNGAFISIHALAAAAETIAYELLVRISPRVRRVYVRE